MRAEDLPPPPVPKLPKVSVERLEAQTDSICPALVLAFNMMHHKEALTPCLASRWKLWYQPCSSAILALAAEDHRVIVLHAAF